MKISNLVFVALLSLGFSLAASAKEFKMQITPDSENADGNFASLKMNKGFEGQLQYELIPTTSDVASDLAQKSCPGSLYRVEGSVLARHQEMDEETHRPGTETVKLLVRKLSCIGISGR